MGKRASRGPLFVAFIAYTAKMEWQIILYSPNIQKCERGPPTGVNEPIFGYFRAINFIFGDQFQDVP